MNIDNILFNFYNIDKNDLDYINKKQELLNKINAIENRNNKKYIKKNKEILILCDSGFMNNSSGIYTFIKYLSKLFTDLDYSITLLSEYPCDNLCNFILNLDNLNISFPKNIVKSNYEYKRETYNYIEFQENVSIPSYKIGIKEYLENTKPIMIIANSYASTKAMIESDVNCIKLSYTHIGDLLDEKNKDLYDFDDDSTKEYLNLYKNNEIFIGTQTVGTKNKLEKIINRNTGIFHLNEPFYILEEILDFYNEKQGIIIISGNYKRKNYEDMLELVSGTDIPITIICGNPIHGNDNLHELIYKKNIKKYRIIENIDNSFVHNIINQHRLMIHLSNIEIFPYSVLEGLCSVPCIINGNSVWGEYFLEDCIKLKYSNVNEHKNKLIDIYNNYEKYNTFKIGEYIKNTTSMWQNFIEENICLCN